MDNRIEQSNKYSHIRFVQNLMFKKQEIETAIANLKESRKASTQHRSSDDFFEELDHADYEISTQQYYVLLGKKYSELKNIEKLIRRILRDGDFGWCEECGERIGRKRLSAMPDATRCIKCQQEHEKMESWKGSSYRKYKK